MEKNVENALRDFAKWIDEGFSLDEELAVKYVDDFISVSVGKYKPECNHNWNSFGDGDIKCTKCGEWQ